MWQKRSTDNIASMALMMFYLIPKKDIGDTSYYRVIFVFTNISQYLYVICTFTKSIHNSLKFAKSNMYVGFKLTLINPFCFEISGVTIVIFLTHICFRINNENQWIRVFIVCWWFFSANICASNNYFAYIIVKVCISMKWFHCRKLLQIGISWFLVLLFLIDTLSAQLSYQMQILAYVWSTYFPFYPIIYCLELNSEFEC